MSAIQVYFPKEPYQALIGHCLRKFNEEYLPEEPRERKAYGLVGGVFSQDNLTVKKIFPLKRNMRKENLYDEEMTHTMYEHGIPSKTPFERRGWVADPGELFQIYNEADKDKIQIVGSYHMHLVPWPGDALRDTPTEIDTVLARGSNLYTFIISMVDPEHPILRAFFEGVLEREAPIVFSE